MLREHALLKSLLLLLLLSSTAPAKTWIVGGSGADFDEIQPAIDAASDGDVILVRNVKVYQSFILNKGLSIRSSSGSFLVAAAASGPTIQITGIGGGKAAKLAGATVEGHVALTITSSSGEVCVEDTSLNGLERDVLFISDCTNVHLDQVDVGASIIAVGPQ